ncbi:MAG: hypothetical protein H0W64_08355 [Gammaproteobacteria bacterium]|nr:hypothetical protein [Gammaproteobacteria bacterium]
MTTVLIGLISVVVGRVLLSSYTTFLTAQNTTDIDWQGFLAIERITNDIHTIRAASTLTTMGASQMTMVNTSGTTVQYALSGATLTRNGQTLADNVQNFALSYLDRNGAITAIASSVRYISMSLTLTESNMSANFIGLAGLRTMP